MLRPEHLEQLKALGQSEIPLDMPPPLLVVEGVSPGTESRRRDYFDKRNQYEWHSIPEYWIVDPHAGCVTVSAMVEGAYTETVFNQGEAVISPMFPQ